jgi:hypothetical protein
MAMQRSPGLIDRRVSDKKSSSIPFNKGHEDYGIFDFSDHLASDTTDVAVSNTDSTMSSTDIVGAGKHQSTVEVISVDNFPTQQQENLLCFPFLAGEKVKLAGKRLNLCDSLSTYVTNELITMQLQKTVGRNQIVTICKLDHMTLNPSTFVNDTVMDFWMAWLTCNLSDEVSSIIIFTSHFYSTLTNENWGLDHVSHWTH